MSQIKEKLTIQSIQTEGMAMTNFTNYEKRQFVDFIQKYPCIIYTTNSLKYKY